MVQTKNNGRKFVDFIRFPERDINHFNPIVGSFAVIKCRGKYLLCYNVWRNQWEIPAGNKWHLEVYEGRKDPEKINIVLLDTVE